MAPSDVQAEFGEWLDAYAHAWAVEAEAELESEAEVVDDADAALYESEHAPKGGITIQGQEFAGGQFIPGEVLEKATDEEKAKLRDDTDADQADSDDSDEATPATDDYAFARESAIPNVGEDILQSARHKRNAWRGLTDAEENGTAVELVTREKLLKNEPPNLMAEVSSETALTTLAMHMALSKFPAGPRSTPIPAPPVSPEALAMYGTVDIAATAAPSPASPPGPAVPPPPDRIDKLADAIAALVQLQVAQAHAQAQAVAAQAAQAQYQRDNPPAPSAPPPQVVELKLEKGAIQVSAPPVHVAPPAVTIKLPKRIRTEAIIDKETGRVVGSREIYEEE